MPYSYGRAFLRRPWGVFDVALSADADVDDGRCVDQSVKVYRSYMYTPFPSALAQGQLPCPFLSFPLSATSDLSC